MRREVEYHWHVRELMARMGMRNSRDLVEPLRDRGITLSESQIYRIVAQDPERIAFKVLVALADIFRVEVNDLVTYTATDARAQRPKKVAGAAAEIPLIEACRPIRARITKAEDDD
ncbi:helix-turn-helix transcriptional regulator [Microbacterium foliorum]|uniref:Helix-turn-helix transcriptional regulator n=1 Tax=Microbacterium foliorum TaxID=104336 RepID=A0A4Y5YQY6_9MICO|nr:helix-turn-helix transcriptional regulator [Microbacterium foliorum]QDE34839.1 helix-turn-helix transcriptional regulator [Microbacterium foliorum]